MKRFRYHVIRYAFKLFAFMALTLYLIAIVEQPVEASGMVLPFQRVPLMLSVELKPSLSLPILDNLEIKLDMFHAPDSDKIKNLTAQELHNRYKQIVLIDVRTSLEYWWKHIPGSERLNRQQILKRIPKDKPIAVVCLSGHRSIPTAKWLMEQEYEQVYNLKGGFWTWWRAGYPVKSGSQPS